MRFLLLNFSLALSSLMLTTAAEYISDISFSNLKFSVLDGSSAYPQNVWKANLDFSIPNPSAIKTDDYFSIYMPKVYQVYYNYPDHYFNISMNGNAVFQCYAEQQAGSKNTESIMSCSSYTDFTQTAEIFGSLEFAFTFDCGAGDILSSNEIVNANYFQSGVSTEFEFYDDNDNSFAAQVTFAAMSVSDDLMNVVRNPADETLEIYYAAPTCSSNGHITSGTVQYFMQAGTTFDQLHSNGGVSSDSTHNEFYMLNATQNNMFAPKKMSTENGQNVAKFGFSSVEPDEMIWFNVIQTVGPKTAAVSNTYEATYTCVSGSSTWSEVHNTLTVIDFKFASNYGSLSYTVPTVRTKTTTFTGYWDSTYSTTTTEAINTTPVDNTVIVTIHVELPTPVVTSVSTFNNVQSTVSISTIKETDMVTELNTKTQLETQTQTLTTVSTTNKLITTTATTSVEVPTTVTTSKVQTTVVSSLIRETETVTTENTIVSTLTFPVVTQSVTTRVTNFTSEYYTNIITVPSVFVSTFVDTQLSTVTTEYTISITSLSTATATSVVPTAMGSSYVSTFTDGRTFTSLVTSAVLSNVTLTSTATTTTMPSGDIVTETQKTTMTTSVGPVTVVESVTVGASETDTQAIFNSATTVTTTVSTSSTSLSTSSSNSGDNQQNYKLKTASLGSLESVSTEIASVSPSSSGTDFPTSIFTETVTPTEPSAVSAIFDVSSISTVETFSKKVDTYISTAKASISTISSFKSASTISPISFLTSCSSTDSSPASTSTYTAPFIQFENNAKTIKTPLALLFSILFSIICL